MSALFFGVGKKGYGTEICPRIFEESGQTENVMYGFVRNARENTGRTTKTPCETRKKRTNRD